MWQSSILSTLHHFQQKGLYCDVSIQSTDEVSTSVHACVLGAVWPEIHAQMSSRESLVGAVIPVPVPGSELQDLVSLIYEGSVAADTKLVSEGLKELLSQLNIQMPVKQENEGNDEGLPASLGKDGSPKGMIQERPWTQGSKLGQSLGEAHAKARSEGESRKDVRDAAEMLQAGVEPADDADSDAGPASSPAQDDADAKSVASVKEDVDERGTEMKDVLKTRRGRRKAKPQVKVTGMGQEGKPAVRKRGRPRKNPLPEDATTEPNPKKEPTKREVPKPKVKRTPPSTICSYCGKTFQKSWHRLRHERTHTGLKPFKCNYCDKTFSRASHAKRHENLHTGEKIYVCKHCGKEFKHNSQFYYHERSHREQNSYQCQYCEKRFSWKQSLEAHERAHRGEILHQCSICHKSFTASSVLKDHEKAHRGEKEFQCSYCPARFVRRYGVVVHERTHTGEKPFPCRLCNKKFRTQSARTEHERTHASASESGEIQLPGGRTLRPKEKKPKTQACSYCGKLFLKNCQRVIHERSHTGEKPFSCSFCGKGFADITHMRRHEKLHSEQSPVEPKAEADRSQMGGTGQMDTQATVQVIQTQQYVEPPVVLAWHPTSDAEQLQY